MWKKHEKSCTGASDADPILLNPKKEFKFHATVQHRNLSYANRSENVKIEEQREIGKKWKNKKDVKCPHCDKVAKSASIMDKHIRSTHQGGV